MKKFAIVKEFIKFLGERKKFWLLPILVLFFIAGAMLVAVQGSVFAPFIYSFI